MWAANTEWLSVLLQKCNLISPICQCVEPTDHELAGDTMRTVALGAAAGTEVHNLAIANLPEQEPYE